MRAIEGAGYSTEEMGIALDVLLQNSTRMENITWMERHILAKN